MKSHATWNSMPKSLWLFPILAIATPAWSAERSAETFRAVAKLVGPSVVTIKVTQDAPPQRAVRRKSRPSQQDSFEDFLEQFGFSFGHPGGQGPGGPVMRPQNSSGSGFIVDKRGYIVTNNHVVKEGGKITVLFPDEEAEEVTARVVGSDSRTDLAVLKVDLGRDLPTTEWADSDSVEVGDSAIAIGSPFMLTHSVTAGIVSAKGRNASGLIGADFAQDLIQTDAAINPGNSGGPLCTSEGTVMGVNTAIFTQSGGYMGIGFAIPSNLAKQVVATLIQDGKITRGWLGVAIQKADKELLKELGVAAAVMVHEVQDDSPAAKAGLKAGDAIVQIGDEKVTKVQQVQRVIASKRPGDRLPIKVIHYEDRKARTVMVRIGELPKTS